MDVREIILLAALLPLAATSAASRALYVDAARGRDDQDGRAPATAWSSLARVNRAELAPGDRVLFRRGQQWRGQLIPRSGSPEGVITYGAFGEGEKPVLLGSVSAHQPEDWQPAGAGLWATAPLRFAPEGASIDLGRLDWSLHQEAGAACAMKSEKAADAGAKMLQLSCRQPGARGHHLQLSVVGLTVEEGAYYLFTFQARATKAFAPASISLMKSAPPWTAYASAETAPPPVDTNWAEHTIRFRARQSAADARITLFLGGVLPADAILSFQPGLLRRARLSGGLSLPVDVGNIIFDGGLSTGTKKWSVADLRQEGDYFYDPKTKQVVLRSDSNPPTRHRSIELALRQHIIDESGRAYVTYENLDLRYGAAHGIGGGGVHHITVRDCDISFIGGGHQHTRPDGKPVRFGNGIEFWSGARDCLVEGCRIWEIYDAALTNQGDGTNVQENITYRRNVIWNSEYSFEFWNRSPASRTRNIVFEHNTCVDAGHGWGHRQRPDPNGRHLMFYDNSSITTNVVVRHNIFCHATDSLLRLHGRDWTAALALDHNLWWQPQGPLVLWGKDKIGPAEFVAFMRDRGFDPQPLVKDPQFVNPAQRDYRLAPASPARALANQGRPAGALP